MSIIAWLRGGWKTHGPGTQGIAGAYASESSAVYDNVSADSALKLSAAWACINLRSETLGTLPIHLRDGAKKIISDHPAYAVAHDSPNAMQTPAEWMSMQQAHVDMHGNGLSIVERRSNGTPISVEPVNNPTDAELVTKKSGRAHYLIDGEKHAVEDVLHFKGFSMQNGWGIPRIDIGRQILSSQISANTSAAMAFKNGLKIGGFFAPENNLTEDQQRQFNERLDFFGRSENAGKFLTLVKGMKPISGAEYRIKPAEAELLMSRFFGIEEICRLFNVPPQLIGHSDKASSWASSLEQVNLFFLMYSLQPSFIRHEQRLNKTLLSAADRRNGLHFKYSIQGLLRSDMKTQSLMFASALQNGYYSVNEVRDLLDRVDVGPEGDEYRVQMNMVQLGQETAPAEDAKQVA